MANKRIVSSWLILGGILSGSACCSVGMLTTSPPETHSTFVYISHTQIVKECSGKKCIKKATQSTGSGFVIANTKSGSWALTAAHLCVSEPSAVASKLAAATRGGTVFPVSIIHIFKDVDACVVVIHGTDLPTVSLAQSVPKQGDYVTALGAPAGIFDNDLIAKFSGFYAGTTTEVRDPRQPSRVYPVLAGYTVSARPGSSGGPIFNSSGKLVGMVIMANPSVEAFALSPTFRVIQAIVKGAREASRTYPEGEHAR
jgi:S1-C subfamily serine protease